MRQIKFRGKCLHCDKWVYGNLVDFGEDEIPEIHGFDPYREGSLSWREINVERSTIGQFTGLLDKNGKEIYEGDIIECGTKRYTCEYIEGGFEFRDMTGGELILKAIVIHSSIIGNIYDSDFRIEFSNQKA